MGLQSWQEGGPGFAPFRISHLQNFGSIGFGPCIEIADTGVRRGAWPLDHGIHVDFTLDPCRHHGVYITVEEAKVPLKGRRATCFPLTCVAPLHHGWKLVASLRVPGVMNNGSQDRKSTRLNSSHGYISYAVFCLKKKNYTHILN